MDQSSPSSGSVQTLVVWLRERHGTICLGEAKALEALHDNNDETAYRELMRERAENLAGLCDDAAPLLEALPPPLRERTGYRLEQFSQGARNALRLNSIFYMSALLYPDEHQKGEPDNLARLIAELAEA